MTVKNEWGTGLPLVDQLRDDLAVGRYPLIVMEGTWQQKQRKVNGSRYLSNAFAHLRSTSGALFTFGWALNRNDLHVMTAVARSSVDRLYIGLFGGRHLGGNPGTVGEAHRLRAESGDRIEVKFWDTRSASVW